MKTPILILVAFAITVLNAVAATTFKVLPSFGPPANAASFQAYALDAAVKIKSSGTLPTGAPNGPTDARFLPSVGADDLMTTTTAAFYRGVFSPPSPYNNERGGTVWWWIEVTAGTGETVSLADIAVTLNSSDSGNVLGKTVTFTGTFYSPTSPGILADGTEVTSGPASQQVKRVIVGVASVSFSVGTSGDVQAVRDFIGQANWSTRTVVTAKGASSSLVLNRIMPTLKVSNSGGRLLLSRENNGDPVSYEIQKSAALGASAVWSSAGIISPGVTNDMGSVASGAGFIRYKP